MILSFEEKTYINFTHQQSKTGRASGPENIFPALPGHSPDLPNNLPQSKLITLRLFHFMFICNIPSSIVARILLKVMVHVHILLRNRPVAVVIVPASLLKLIVAVGVNG